VELPDGVRFEQYVIRVPRSTMVAVLEDREHLLLMRRHRFVFDRWVWVWGVGVGVARRLRQRRRAAGTVIAVLELVARKVRGELQRSAS